MSVITGRVRGGQVVLEGEGSPLPEGRRVTIVIEEDSAGFHLDESSQDELVEAMREIARGDFVTKEELFAEMKELK